MISFKFIAKFFYKHFLRGYIKKQINNPNVLWDNYVMILLDDIFDINKAEGKNGNRNEQSL